MLICVSVILVAQTNYTSQTSIDFLILIKRQIYFKYVVCFDTTPTFCEGIDLKRNTLLDLHQIEITSHTHKYKFQEFSRRSNIYKLVFCLEKRIIFITKTLSLIDNKDKMIYW
jgi:hypothetical protein